MLILTPVFNKPVFSTIGVSLKKTNGDSGRSDIIIVVLVIV